MRNATHIGPVGLNIPQQGSLPADGALDDLVLFGGAWWRHNGATWVQTAASAATAITQAPPGADGEDGEDGRTIPGATGAAGAAGQFIRGDDGEDGEDGRTIPGATGAAGAAGAPGAAGAAGAPGQFVRGDDGEDGEDGRMVPASTASASGGVSDGDKGDITVSGAGAAWTIDASAVTYAKIQDVSAAGRLLGSSSSGASLAVQELTLADGLELNVTNLSCSVAHNWAKIPSGSAIGIAAAADPVTLNRLHIVLGTAGDYTITISGLSPSVGDVIGFYVRDYAAASQQYTLDAGGTVKIAGRTRYLKLVHTNVVLLRWDAAGWQPLVLSLDTPWVSAGTMTITATTTSPAKGTTAQDVVYWRRQGQSLQVRYRYRQTIGGTAGSGEYLLSIPIGEIDTAIVPAVTGLSATWVTDVSCAALLVGGHANNGSSRGPVVAAAVYSSTKLRFGFQAVFSSANAWSHTYYSLNTPTINIGLEVSLPMLDW